MTSLKLTVCALAFLFTSNLFAESYEYRVLATSRTATMEKELNEAAAAGFRFENAIGGESAYGGKEVVAVMKRAAGEAGKRFHYRLLATNKTSTMQQEIDSTAKDGYIYRAQTVFQTAFGGKEVVIIMERDTNRPERGLEYRLLSTNRTSTMDRELAAAGEDGFELVGITVAETAFGGKELVCVLKRGQ